MLPNFCLPEQKKTDSQSNTMIQDKVSMLYKYFSNCKSCMIQYCAISVVKKIFKKIMKRHNSQTDKQQIMPMV